MIPTTFEFFYCKYKGKYLLYLDPFYFSFYDIFPRKQIKEITAIVMDYKKKSGKRKIKIPINENTINPFMYRDINEFINENDECYCVEKIIINNSIEISAVWWYSILLIADKDTILKALKKHLDYCGTKESDIIKKLPYNLNKYYKINRDATLEVKRMNAANFIKHAYNSDLYSEKVWDIENSSGEFSREILSISQSDYECHYDADVYNACQNSRNKYPLRRTTFEYFLSSYKDRYMLYLDPYYFSFNDIIQKTDIKDVDVIVWDNWDNWAILGDTKTRNFKLPINEKTINLFMYLKVFHEKNPIGGDKDWDVKKIIINNTIEISSVWYYDLLMVADKETILKVLEKHKVNCKSNELEIINKLPKNMNKYFKINRDSTVDVKRMSAAKFIKFIKNHDLHAEKAFDLVNDPNKELYRRTLKKFLRLILQILRCFWYNNIRNSSRVLRWFKMEPKY